MDLIDQLRTIADRASDQGHTLLTEEATKNALIMPFINALGARFRTTPEGRLGSGGTGNCSGKPWRLRTSPFMKRSGGTSTTRTGGATTSGISDSRSSTPDRVMSHRNTITRGKTCRDS